MKSKSVDKMQILQEKQNLQEMFALKIETVDDFISNVESNQLLRKSLEKQESRDKLEKFLSSVEKLYQQHGLVLDLLGDNLFVGNNEKSEFDIKLVDYGCFQMDEHNKWDDDIHALSEFIGKIRNFLSKYD